MLQKRMLWMAAMVVVVAAAWAIGPTRANADDLAIRPAVYTIEDRADEGPAVQQVHWRGGYWGRGYGYGWGRGYGYGWGGYRPYYGGWGVGVYRPYPVYAAPVYGYPAYGYPAYGYSYYGGCW